MITDKEVRIIITCEKSIQELLRFEEAIDNKDICIVDWFKNMYKLNKEKSCGKCVMCRDGSMQLYKIIEDITEGRGESEDIELMTELALLSKENASCEMAQNSADNLLNSIERYKDEWELHIKRKRCSALVCKKYITVHIMPEKCLGCTQCIDVCSENAIEGSEGMIHVINQEKCSHCLSCINVCHYGAFEKAGAAKPKTPDAPIPVGSFENSRRRKRRGAD